MLTRNRFLAAFGLLALALLFAGTIVPGRQASVPAQAADPVGVVVVDHYSIDLNKQIVDPVEPYTGENWSITAKWADNYTETGYVRVDWNGSSWVLSGAQYTTRITAYAAYSNHTCGTQQAPHGYGYKLEAMVNEYHGGYGLVSVTFDVSSVDDGYTLTGTPCSHTNSVSPVQVWVWQAVDTGTFEGSFSPNNNGPGLTLPYQ
jgi:hypothetical protein